MGTPRASGNATALENPALCNSRCTGHHLLGCDLKHQQFGGLPPNVCGVAQCGGQRNGPNTSPFETGGRRMRRLSGNNGAGVVLSLASNEETNPTANLRAYLHGAHRRGKEM
eukprot:scaffold85249_cov27-Tisochrysis_lutea.AAC.2